MQDVIVGGNLHGHKLLEKVGQGHYGEVWRAEYAGHEVALKIFSGDRKPAHLRREVFAPVCPRPPRRRGGPLVSARRASRPRRRPALSPDGFIEGSPLENLLSPSSLSLDERLVDRRADPPRGWPRCMPTTSSTATCRR